MFEVKKIELHLEDEEKVLCVIADENEQEYIIGIDGIEKYTETEIAETSDNNFEYTIGKDGEKIKIEHIIGSKKAININLEKLLNLSQHGILLTQLNGHYYFNYETDLELSPTDESKWLSDCGIDIRNKQYGTLEEVLDRFDRLIKWLKCGL